MSNQLYPSDLTDQHWEYIKGLIPAAKPGGRNRETDMRQTLNAIFYIDRAGCAWRYLPREYPPWQTVYGYFRTWRLDGTWQHIHDRLRGDVREQEGRERQPSAAIITPKRSKRLTAEEPSAVMTAARKPLAANDISSSTRSACCCWLWFTRPAFKIGMGLVKFWPRWLIASRDCGKSGPMASTRAIWLSG